MVKYYQADQLNGYYRISSPENVFSFLFIGTEKAALLDTGYGFGNLKEAVKELTDKPLIILNTHGHCDHVGGNAQFEEVCYLHEKDFELCREHTAYEMRKDNAARAEQSMNFETRERYNALPEEFRLEEYCKRGTGKLMPLKEGDCFELGGITLETYETPGHTKGGISVFYKEKNLLFVGDATGPFVWLFSGETTDLKTYVNAVRKMYDLNADGYIGGHNPKIMKKEDLLRFIRAAEEADYEKGMPFHSFFGNEYEPRVCALDGMTEKDMFHPEFASVVIGKGKKERKEI